MNAWIAVAVLLAPGVVDAQALLPRPAITTQEDYSDAMKDIAAQNTLLRKSLTSKSEGDAISAAARLEANFKKVLAYWDDKQVEDARAEATKAAAAAQDIAKALQNHDIQGATTASQALAGTCMACHAAHRDRLTDGFYKIK